MTWQTKQNVSQALPQDELRPLYGEVVHRIEAAAKIPIWHAGTTFVIVFGLIFSLSQALTWVGWFWWGIFFSGLAAGAVYLIELWRWNVMRERYSKGYHQESPKDDFAPRQMVHVRHDRVKKNGHFQQEEYDLPGTPEALQMLARGVLNGRPFTETVWAGKNRPFAYREFRELRRIGLEKGIFEYINPDEPKVGIRITEGKGRDLFEELADGDTEEFDG